jgi:hypothetical protein
MFDEGVEVQVSLAATFVIEGKIHPPFPLDWLARASCRTVDPELFCLDNGIDAATTALMMCSACPVLSSCGELTDRIVERNEPPTGLVQGGIAHRMRPTADMGHKEWLHRRVSSRNRVLRQRLTNERLTDEELLLDNNNLVAASLARIEVLRRQDGVILLPPVPEEFRRKNQRTVEISVKRKRARLRRQARKSQGENNIVDLRRRASDPAH